MQIIVIGIVLAVLFDKLNKWESPSQKQRRIDNDPKYFYKSGNYPCGYYSVEERYGKKKR